MASGADSRHGAEGAGDVVVDVDPRPSSSATTTTTTTTTTTPSTTTATWRQVLWCGAAFSILLVPNALAIATPFEAWPLTSAPMFAASPLDNARYELRLVVERRGADGRIVDAAFPTRPATGLSGWHFSRAFLVSAWGGDDDDAPYGYRDNDTDDARGARVARLLGGIVRFERARAQAKKKPSAFANAVAVRVELVQKHPHLPAGVSDTRVLGRYVVDDDAFVYEDGHRGGAR